jgi:hypothetical protein
MNKLISKEEVYGQSTDKAIGLSFELRSLSLNPNKMKEFEDELDQEILILNLLNRIFE